MTSDGFDFSGEYYVRDAEAAVRLFAPIATSPHEIAVFAYLDPEWRLLGMRHTPAGEADRVDLPIRSVAADAIAFDAASVVMAHNHPGGDATPSRADFAATRRLARALDVLGVQLIDHLVLAGDTVTSLRASGLL